MIKIMPTEIVKTEKLVMEDIANNQTIFFWLNAQDQIFITNEVGESFDASVFWLAISKEDWPEVKKFIDKQLSL